MAKQNKRFEIIHQEGNGLSIAYTVFLDTATGVQYLFAQSALSHSCSGVRFLVWDRTFFNFSPFSVTGSTQTASE